MKYWKAYINVIKSLVDNNGWFGDRNVIHEPLIEAETKQDALKIIAERYPQFFANGKVYTRETKDQAQFFYVNVYELSNNEIELIQSGEWTCTYCRQVHLNEYISRPRISYKMFVGDKFCSKDSPDSCFEKHKQAYYKNNGVDMPDDLTYITAKSPTYIYKVTEKATGKCYIGKTRNEPFFRWWNHYKHSSSPFGQRLAQSNINEWTFEVLEILPPEVKDGEVFRIESTYMVQFNSIENGYNTVISNKKVLETTNP